MPKRLPWIHNRKRSEPDAPYEPPLHLGNLSNGEFYKEQTPYDRKLRKLILDRCDENARRVGMDRRDFIASTMGMATTLACVNLASGCGSSDDGTVAAGGSGGSGGIGGSGGAGHGDGGYAIPPDAMVDEGIADELLTGDEFIFDLQTHHVEDEQHWKEAHPDGTYIGAAVGAALSFADCGLPERYQCVMPDQYVRNIFLESDTTVAVLSGFPFVPIADDGSEGNHPIGNVDMANSRDRVNEAAQSQRMVQHCQVSPNDQWDLQAAMMERIRSERGNHGWKIYPGFRADNPTGWFMDDPAIADPFFEKCLELGEPIVCAHKGFPLSFDPVYVDPRDVGPAAVKWPDIKFIIYHSGFDTPDVQTTDGADALAYDPNNVRQGVDRLVKTVEEHDLKNKNVYAEMGSAWLLVMSDPIAAQHYVGKMLKYLGEDRLLFGSECVWFNSPQPQIEALRTFQISKEFQDKYGYPEITNEIRRKIFGLSAARAYGIDPLATRNAIDLNRLALERRELDGEFGGRRWMFAPPNGPRSRREFLRLQQWRKFLGVPA